MKYFKYTVLLFIVYQFYSCGSPTETVVERPIDKLNIPLKDIVVFTASFQDSYDKLVFMDINNTENYVFVESDSAGLMGVAAFNSAKNKLLVTGSTWIQFEVGYPFYLYDLQDDMSRLVYGRDANNDIICKPGRVPVWFNDDSGFFIYGFKDFLYFKFEDWNYYKIPPSTQNPKIIAGLKIDNTIIAVENLSYVPVKKIYKSQSDSDFRISNYSLNGELIESFSNQYIQNGKLLTISYTQKNIEWSQSAQKFVLAELEEDKYNSKISITDYTGSYYRTFTDGSSRDYFPTWGPDGEKIFFIRDIGYEISKIMMIDVNQGTVQDFLNPADLGARSLENVEY